MSGLSSEITKTPVEDLWVRLIALSQPVFYEHQLCVRKWTCSLMNNTLPSEELTVQQES